MDIVIHPHEFVGTTGILQPVQNVINRNLLKGVLVEIKVIDLPVSRSIRVNSYMNRGF